jgi:transposase
VHAAVSGLGLPVRLSLSPGQFGDPGQVPALLGGLEPVVVIADKGYDSRAVVERVEAAGAEAVIPTQKSRKVQRQTDRERYKDRNLAERFWARAKQYRRVATRYDKKAQNFMAFVHVAAVMILLR